MVRKTDYSKEKIIMAPNARKVITRADEGIRLGYVHLIEPYSSSEDRDPKFSCMLIIPKSAKRTLSAIKAAQQAAVEEQKAKFGGKIPKNLRTTLHDGDEEADLEKNPELEGCFFMNVSATRRPGLVDRDLNPILDPTEIYSGMYARVSMSAYCYNTQGNKGVTFGLENVQKVRDGEVLGGGASRAEDDFDVIEDDGEDDFI